jgi:hypothetical protein
MTHEELISLADQNFGDWRTTRCSNPESPTLIETCEEFYMNGAVDKTGGDVGTIGHFYLIDKWIVYTDSQGFNDIEEYDDLEQANEQFDKYIAMEV